MKFEHLIRCSFFVGTKLLGYSYRRFVPRVGDYVLMRVASPLDREVRIKGRVLKVVWVDHDGRNTQEVEIKLASR